MGLLCAAASGCDVRTPTTMATPSSGEIQLIVTSVSGTGVDPNRVRVELNARTVGVLGSWEGSAVDVGTSVSLRVFPGSYRVRATVHPLDYTRLGYSYGCASTTPSDTVSVAEDQRIVVRWAFVCTSPGAAQVRTSVTGVDLDLKLRVQLAHKPGICDMELSEDPYLLNYYLPWVFPVAQIGSRTHGPMWPDSYRMNLCGLPPSCTSTASSQAFIVKEDEITDVLFAIRCPQATDGAVR